MGMKFGSLSVLNFKPLSPSDSERFEISSFASKSFQSTSPTLVIAVESTIGVAGRKLDCGLVTDDDLTVLEVAFEVPGADGFGAGATEGTTIGPLHLGHGSVCPKSGSWRTIILLEQCGQASRNGSTGGTECGQGKREQRHRCRRHGPVAAQPNFSCS